MNRGAVSCRFSRTRWQQTRAMLSRRPSSSIYGSTCCSTPRRLATSPLIFLWPPCLAFSSTEFFTVPSPLSSASAANESFLFFHDDPRDCTWKLPRRSGLCVAGVAQVPRGRQGGHFLLRVRRKGRAQLHRLAPRTARPCQARGHWRLHADS